MPVWRLITALAAVSIITLDGCQPGGAGSDATTEGIEPATDAPEPSTSAPDTTSGERPAYYLIDADGERIAGQIGSWCWADMCVDLDAPPHPESYAPVMGGTITLALDPPLPEKLVLSLRPAQGPGGETAGAEIAPDGLEVAWTPDASPGEYVLAVHGSYEGGTADLSYTFGVALAADGATRLVAPPRLYLTVGGEPLAEAMLGSYCWPPAHDTYTALPDGEPLRLQFDENPPAILVLNLHDGPALYADGETQPLATFTIDPVQEPVEWSPDVPPGD